MPHRDRQTSLATEGPTAGRNRLGELIGHPWIRLVTARGASDPTIGTMRAERDRAA